MTSFRVSFCRFPPSALPLKVIGRFNVSLYRSRAVYDSLTKALTSMLWILMISINLVMFYLTYTLGPNFFAYLVASSIAIVSLVLLIVLFLFSPRSYEITLDGVVVRRFLRSFLIPEEKISSVKRVKWSWRHLRLWGCGGVYGFFGLFSFRGIGRVWMYVTNRHNLVLITTIDDTNYVISPENPDEFMVELIRFLSKLSSKRFITI